MCTIIGDWNDPVGGAMATDGSAGSIAALWRFPVKSMQGERLVQAELTTQGLLGDRAYAIVDRETGKVASAKSVRLFPNLLRLSAAFVEPPRVGDEIPPVRITLPDGEAVTSDAGDIDRVLSRWFRREVTLARSAPADFTIEQYHPDVEHADPAGHRDICVEQKLGAALFSQIGADSPVPAGAFFDVFPLSVLTSSTLERCVMTTLAQEGLDDDLEVLRTLVRHNRIEVAGMGPAPCAGAYAVIESPGTLRAGDRMAVG
jgi:uncharacterized protein